MARMSIDDRFLRDPRVYRLARDLGWSTFEAQGRLLHVFAVAYDRIDAGSEEGLMAPDDVDIAGAHPGLADALVRHDLAEQTRRGLRIRGARERAKYLQTRESAGRAGGLKSGETRRNRAKVQTKVSFEASEAPSNPSADPSVPDAASAPDAVELLEDSDTPAAVGSPLDSFKAQVDRAAAARSPRTKAKASDPTPAERDAALRVLGKLSHRNGVQYTGSPQHIRLIARHLRAGVDEMTLRYVVGYCAIELGWATDPKMAAYLRPETLFGPQTLAKYLDPALTWASRLDGDHQPATGAA